MSGRDILQDSATVCERAGRHAVMLKVDESGAAPGTRHLKTRSCVDVRLVSVSE
jgi:hypothetical protein